MKFKIKTFNFLPALCAFFRLSPFGTHGVSALSGKYKAAGSSLSMSATARVAVAADGRIGSSGLMAERCDRPF
jgi:hypothetical protein